MPSLEASESSYLRVGLVAVALGTLCALSPWWTLGVLIAALGTLVLSRAANYLPNLAFFLLASKPLLDLAWRLEFFEIANQTVNPQTLVAALAILLALPAAFKGSQRLHVLHPIPLLILSTFVSFLLSPTSAAAGELLRLYASLAVFILTGCAIVTRAQFNRLVAAFVIVVAVPVVLSLLQKLGALPFEYWDWLAGQRVGRVTGTYKHPLNLASFLIYAVPGVLYLLGVHKPQQPRTALLFLFLIAAAAVTALTYHRTAIVVISIQTLLWLVLVKRPGRALVLLLLAVGFTAVFGNWIEALYGGLLRTLQGDPSEQGSQLLRGRGVHWYLFLQAFSSSSLVHWVFGHGVSLAEGWVPGIGLWVSREPHSDFIRILHTYGIAGLGLYTAVLWDFFRKGWKLRSSADGFSRGCGNLMVVTIVAIALLSITTEPTRYPTSVWYLFALGAVVLQRSRVATQEAVSRT